MAGEQKASAISAATCKLMKDRADKAASECKPYHDHLEEIHEYIMPYRRPAEQSGNKGGSRVRNLFDGTAITAAWRFSARMQQDVTPSFQKFFTLEPGPLLEMDEAEEKDAKEMLADVTTKVNGVINAGNFSVAAGEMYTDLFAGTGSMLMLEDEDQLVKFVAVPTRELSYREDGFGAIIGIYWPKKIKAGDIRHAWPESKLDISAELGKLIKDEPDKEIEVLQCTEYDRAQKRWVTAAFWTDEVEKSGAFFSASERTNPWLTPRFYKVPGEATGRGPAMMGLPTARSLNKVMELSIKSAAMAILGIWTYRNDQVFNPKMAKMVPGAMWQVGSNGGMAGGTVNRLDVPGRFDISNLITAELRDTLKSLMLDDALPPDNGSVRSATEIVERMKRRLQDLSGAYSRLVMEIIVPLVRRVMDILAKRQLIQQVIPIDDLLFKVTVLSPIALQYQAQQVTRVVEGLQIIQGLLGQEMMHLTANTDKVATFILKALGVENDLIRSDVDRKQLMQVIGNFLAQMRAAQNQNTEGQAA